MSMTHKRFSKSEISLNLFIVSCVIRVTVMEDIDGDGKAKERRYEEGIK